MVLRQEVGVCFVIALFCLMTMGCRSTVSSHLARMHKMNWVRGNNWEYGGVLLGRELYESELRYRVI
jgi:hypothetical protein